MKFRVEFKPKAARFLERMPEPDRSRMLRRLEALADDPRPAGVEKLKGTEYYRIRTGDYRAVYRIENDVLVVVVVRVGHRKDIYRKR
jgi:mRNA interferase RelE/StbE